MNRYSTLYDRRFYHDPTGGISHSATTILSILFQHYGPGTVLDVGCGRGSWLAAAQQLGASELVGVEGTWVKPHDLASGDIDLIHADLNASFPILPRTFDLSMSLEVAEHLHESRAEGFVEFMCGTSDVVLFSAAIKDQQGTNHVNEQPQSYWIRLFELQGYTAIDLFRPQIWLDNAVKWWYRQNAILFVNSNRIPDSLNIATLKALESPIYDIVHPACYELKMRRLLKPTLRTCAATIGRYLRNAFRH